MQNWPRIHSVASFSAVLERVGPVRLAGGGFIPPGPMIFERLARIYAEAEKAFDENYSFPGLKL